MKKLKLIFLIFVMAVTTVSFADDANEQPLVGDDTINYDFLNVRPDTSSNYTFDEDGNISLDRNFRLNSSSFHQTDSTQVNGFNIGTSSTFLARPQIGNSTRTFFNYAGLEEGETGTLSVFGSREFLNVDIETAFSPNIDYLGNCSRVSVPFTSGVTNLNPTFENFDLDNLDIASSLSLNNFQLRATEFNGYGCYDKNSPNRYCSRDCIDYRDDFRISFDVLNLEIPAQLVVQNNEEVDETIRKLKCCESGVCRVTGLNYSCNQLSETLVADDLPADFTSDFSGISNRTAIMVGEDIFSGNSTDRFCNNCLGYNTEEVQSSRDRLVEEVKPILFANNIRNMIPNARASNAFAAGLRETLVATLENMTTDSTLRDILGDDYQEYIEMEGSTEEKVVQLFEKYQCVNFDTQLIESLNQNLDECSGALGIINQSAVSDANETISSLDNFRISDGIITAPMRDDQRVGSNSELEDFVLSGLQNYIQGDEASFRSSICEAPSYEAGRRQYALRMYNDILPPEVMNQDLRNRFRLTQQDSITDAQKVQYVTTVLVEKASQFPSIIPILFDQDVVCSELAARSDSGRVAMFDANQLVLNNSDAISSATQGLARLRSLASKSCGQVQLDENRRLLCNQVGFDDVRDHPAFRELVANNIDNLSFGARLGAIHTNCIDGANPSQNRDNEGQSAEPITDSLAGTQSRSGVDDESDDPFSRSNLRSVLGDRYTPGARRTDATNQRESIFTGARSDISSGARGAESKRPRVGTNESNSSASSFNGGLSKSENGLSSSMETLGGIRNNFSNSSSSIFNDRRLSAAAISAALESDSELASEVQNKTQELQSLLDNTPGSVGESAADRVQNFLAGNTETALVPSLVDDVRAQELQAEINDLRTQLAETARVSDRARPTDQRLDEALSEIERLRGTVANLQTTQRGILAGSNSVSEIASAASGSPAELGSVRGGQFASLNSEAGRSPSSVSSSNAIPTNIASLIQNQSGGVGFAFEGEQLVIRSGGSIYPAELDNIVVNNGVVQGIVYRGNEISFDALSPESRQAIQRFVETNTPGLIEKKIEEIQASVADIPVEVIQADTDGAEYLQLLEEMRLAASPASN